MKKPVNHLLVTLLAATLGVAFAPGALAQQTPAAPDQTTATPPGPGGYGPGMMGYGYGPGYGMGPGMMGGCGMGAGMMGGLGSAGLDLKSEQIDKISKIREDLFRTQSALMLQMFKARLSAEKQIGAVLTKEQKAQLQHGWGRWHRGGMMGY